MMNGKLSLKALVFSLFAAVSTVAFAADFKINTKSKVGLTDEALKEVKAWLIPEEGGDTIHGKLSEYTLINRNRDTTPVVAVSFTVPHKPGTYLLTAESKGYKTIERTVTIDKIGSRENEMSIPDLLFYPKAKELGEVSVTASKVKFYMRGDTVVYNADAFQLAEGSMLDGLIKQLPGVELKENGQIYVNGKFVESLLLNGKDFFKGDNNIMLNNLGAYTVKNVEIYDKLGERSRLAGHDIGDSEYVMDVKLKREYMSGFIGNFEAGGGTSSRYLGRLFGMWYTNRSRVTLVGNINNLNDSRKPGQNDTYKASAAPGDFRTKMVGLNYNVSGDDNKWEFIGSSSFNHTRNLNLSSTNRTNFLQGGNTYENRFADALSHDLNVSTDNSFYYRPNDMTIGVTQRLKYRNNDLMSTSLSGSFNDEVASLNREILEKVYSGEATSLGDITINSSLSQSLMKGHSLEAGGNLYVSSKIAHTPDLIDLSVSGDYGRRRYRSFDRYDINYNQLGEHSTMSTFTNGSPDHDWNIRIAPSYTYIPAPKFTICLTPIWKHTSAKKDSYFYRLDRLGDAGAFGTLPADYEAALDDGQTYFSTERGDEASMNLNIIGRDDKDFKWSFQVIAQLTKRWRNLDYNQIGYAQRVKHNSLDLQFANTYFGFYSGDNFFKILYERTVNPVQLNRLVNITDSRDPLNIFTGAESLKNTANNSITLSWYRNVRGRHYWFNFLGLRFNIIQDALVNGYSFNETTGVRTYRMFNTDGNWDARLWNNFSKAFGDRDQFGVTSGTVLAYSRAADYSSVNGAEMTESAIKNVNLSQTVGFTWKLGKHSLGVNGRIDWRDTRSANDYFTSFSATTGQIGCNAQLQLPYNFAISTDLNVYTRRGYAYKEMNTTDVVWNARLSYTAGKGRWVFMLDGFDLLHQLNNITYNVNAQGRTETWNNVLPRYGLFHIQYRFAIQPKKR